ncbi:hypothetical protein FM106_02580 [Brachybacterium faecium]|nr:hypothetical protein FM106_02580 [Brachybacterium faecium]
MWTCAPAVPRPWWGRGGRAQHHPDPVDPGRRGDLIGSSAARPAGTGWRHLRRRASILSRI